MVQFVLAVLHCKDIPYFVYFKIKTGAFWPRTPKKELFFTFLAKKMAKLFFLRKKVVPLHRN